MGERILNQLIIRLRDYYKATPEYKTVYRKDSFDNWEQAIDVLHAWDILLSTVVDKFNLLKTRRNKSIHFNFDTDVEDRFQAIEAITLIQGIITEQFSAFGDQPWFITDMPGEVYLKKDWEEKPFIQLVYVPNSVYVGFKHKIESMHPLQIIDYEYEQGTLTDQDFVRRRKSLN